MDIEESYHLQHVQTPLSLKQKLTDKSTTIDDVLNEPMVFRLFSTNDEHIISFFVDHIQELLALTFDAKCPDNSAKAFAILEHSQPQITKAMLDKQRLHNATLLAMSKHVNETLFLSRISSLTLAAVMVDPQTVTIECGYIFQLFSYISEPAVLSMFETMCSNDPDMVIIQKWLLSVGIAQIVHKEIDSFKIPSDVSYDNTDANTLCGYYRLITVAMSSPILAPHFASQAMVSSLNFNINHFPVFVEDYRWEALCAIYNEKTYVIMRGLMQDAIEIFNDEQLAQRKCSVYAIAILQRMIILDEFIRPFLMDSGIFILSIQTILKYPNHSILHESLRGLISAAIHQPECRSAVISSTLPIILSNVRSQNRNIRASMVDLLKIAVEIGNMDARAFELMKAIDGFLLFVRNELSHLNNIEDAPYGGLLPLSAIRDDANLLAERTLQNKRTW